VLVILGAVDFYLTDGQRPGVVGVPGQPFMNIDELGDVAPALQVPSSGIGGSSGMRSVRVAFQMAFICTAARPSMVARS